jgi:hypothetical protein
MTDQMRFEEPSEKDLEQAVAEGRLSRDQFNEILQERQRRAAATRENLPDPTQRHMVEGFGSGQGMGTERTGQEPERPDEQGFPRGEDRDWPG